MKRTVSGLTSLLLLMLLVAQPAAAQSYYPPKAPDYPAQTAPANTAQNGVANTGTDIISLGTGKQLQATVWDDANGGVTLSTVVNPAIGGGSSKAAFKLNAPGGYPFLSDPDIAMATLNGQIYADVVYLASATSGSATTRAFYDVYLWNSTSQSFNIVFVARQALGVASVANLPGFGGGPITRRHSSPNIDANANGIVGIVWQESSTETAQITILSPSYSSTSNPPYPNGYTYIQEGLTFSESYLVPALADGSTYRTCGSTPWRGGLISQLQAYVTNPTPTNNNAPVLFNQTVKPDVAVSADDKWWVSYLVNAAFMPAPATPGEPSVATGLNLVVRKVDFDCFISSSLLTKSWTVGVTTARPRLAASPDPANPNDVEVVQSWNDGVCLDGIGPRSYYEIHNWGCSGGAFRASYNVVSPPTVAGQNGYYAIDPVVAYYPLADGKTYTGNYLVDWMGSNYPANAQEQDVWSRTLKGGTPVYGDYSRVNDDSHLPGNQRTPSVAARYAGVNDASAHAYVDESGAAVRYRSSTVPAGQTGLNRTAPNSSNGADKATGQVKMLEAFPNPFGGPVEFRVRLYPSETVRSLQVTDLSGRVLDTVPLNATRPGSADASGENQPLTVFTWTPRRTLPAGSYLLRISTNQRTETLSLSKN